MIVRVQGSVRCGTCSESFPLNAAVREIPCQACGAEVELQDALWRGILEEAVSSAAELEPNASVTARYTQHETEIRLQLARVAPSCPHCKAGWPHEIEDGFHCPKCREEIPVRPPPVAVDGLLALIAEDRALTGAGDDAPRTATLSCDTCAAPLTADGSARKLTCEACGVEQVLSDEIWRRLHAPTLVASWYLKVQATGAAEGLTGRLWPQALAVDPQGRLYIAGGYGETEYCVLAVDLDPVRIAWMTDLADIRPDNLAKLVVAPRGRLALYEEGEDRVDWFDAQTGAHLGQFRAPGQLLSLAAQVDGTFVAVLHPDNRLARFDVEGNEVPLWPPSGILGRLFGGGATAPGSPPVARMNTAWNSAIAMGWDGDLRIVVPGYVGRIARDGRLVWSTACEGLEFPAPGCVPGSAKDGTTYALVCQSPNQQLKTVLLRLDPNGRAPTVIARHRDSMFTALAVMSTGEVWVADPQEIRRLDRDGNLLWRKRCD